MGGSEDLPQVVRIDDQWEYLWAGELRLVPGDRVLLPKANEPDKYWYGTVTDTDGTQRYDGKLKFVLGLAP